MPVSACNNRYLSLILFLLIAFEPAINISLRAQNATSLTADDPPHTVTFHMYSPEPPSPLQIVGLVVGGKSVQFDSPVEVHGHWLRDIVVIVKNTSSRTITEGGVRLLFYRQGSSTSQPADDALETFVGRYPPQALFRRDGTHIEMPDRMQTAQTLAAGPNAQLRFLFLEDGDEVQANFHRFGAIETVGVQLATFFFDDGSRWSKGVFSVPGRTPGAWAAISPDNYLTTNNRRNQ